MNYFSSLSNKNTKSISFYMNSKIRVVMGYELIVSEKPNAAKRIAEALADKRAKKQSINKVPYYELEHKKNPVVVACAVGHLFTVAEKKKSFTYPSFDL